MGILKLYLAVRKPKNFLILLCTFLVTTLILHFVRGYDTDWGATNLILSIEASIAGAVLMMVAEESAERQRANDTLTARTLATVLAISEATEKTLKGVLLIAEAERDVLKDHAAMLRMLRESDIKILDALEVHAKGHGNEPDQKAVNGFDN